MNRTFLIFHRKSASDQWTIVKAEETPETLIVKERFWLHFGPDEAHVHNPESLPLGIVAQLSNGNPPDGWYRVIEFPFETNGEPVGMATAQICEFFVETPPRPEKTVGGRNINELRVDPA